MAERGAAGSLRARLLLRLAILLTPLLLYGAWSAYWNGRAAADTAYDRTLLASARAIAAGPVTSDGRLRAMRSRAPSVSATRIPAMPLSSGSLTGCSKLTRRTPWPWNSPS